MFAPGSPIGLGALSLDDLSKRKQQLASLELNDWRNDPVFVGKAVASCGSRLGGGSEDSGRRTFLAQAAGEDEKGSMPPKEIDLGKVGQVFAKLLTSATLFIARNDTLFLDGDISNETRITNVTVIEPIIPAPLGDTGWSLVNRPILPIGVSTDIPVAGISGTGASAEPAIDFDNENGLGDFIFFSLLTPPCNGSRFLWGFAPTLRFPTATDDVLGSEKYSAGPAAVALISDPKFTIGLLSQDFFSFAGDDVRASTFQYFAFCSFLPEWGIGTALIASVNWEADDDDDKLLSPVGLGVTHTFRIGLAPARLLLEGQCYAIQPETLGPEWSVRLALGVFLPSLFGQSRSRCCPRQHKDPSMTVRTTAAVIK